MCCSTHAQNYSIDWYSIDGGGGTSTGGTFSVSGTIGQPDAGAMSGGPFTVEGGFWSIIAAIPTPGAPALSIAVVGSMVTVSWPQPGEGWVLDQTSTLTGSPPPWAQIDPPYQVTETNCSVTLLLEPGRRFYRLRKE